MGSFSIFSNRHKQFFIGVLINLLLVALVCYFKEKIDNLELSQSEQAKMLYSLISRQEQENMTMQQQSGENKEIDFNGNNMNFLQNLDLNSLGTTGNYIVNDEEENKIIELNSQPNNTEEEEEESDEDSDEDSDEGSDEETVENSDEDTVEEILEDNLTSSEPNVIKSIQYDETETPTHYDYEKMII